MLAGRVPPPMGLPAVVIIGVVTVLFLTAPKAEDFWWTDAASFALNGELVHDYVASGLHLPPLAFANAWFIRYPAVTISLYPPIFPVAEAIAFTLFGFSHPVAQATVCVFAGLAAFGVFRLLRHAVGPLEATSGVLLIFAAPSILLWSRQVMMEVPALAFLLLASAWFLRYLERRHTRDLMLATLATLAAVYTKQTAIFIVPAFPITLIVCGGWRRLRDKAIWLAAAGGLLGLVPLAVFTWVAAREMLEIALVQGVAARSGDAVGTGAWFAQYRAYLLTLPEVAGWPGLAGAISYIALVARCGWLTAAEQRLAVLMLAWFGCDWLFISATGHFELRYAINLAVPGTILAVLLLSRLIRQPFRPWFALVCGLAVFAISVGTHDVDRMSGYDKVAEFILQHSRQDDVIWFQGNESKNLIFSLRSHSPTPKVYVLRAEKLLADYHIIREWGVQDRGWTSERLQALVDRYDIKMVVLQPDFWADLPSMHRMQDYIESDRFKLVAELPISADEPSQRATIRIFTNRRPATVAEPPTR